MPLEEFIILIFCYVDDQLKKFYPRIRSLGFPPKFSDSEVITIETVGAFLSLETDKAIWSYFKQYWRHLFPHLPFRTTFTRQAANLWKIKQLLHRLLIQEIGLDSVHIVDGFPIPVCHFRRANRGSCFKGEAGYGRSPSKRQLYFGFKGHLLFSASGVIENFILTPANTSEYAVLNDLTTGIEGVLLGDKGYIGEKHKKLLAERGISLQTPLKKNMKDPRSTLFLEKIQRSRKIIESVISQLIYRFKLLKVWARDRWHFVNRLSRQLLAHIFGVFINRSLGRPSLVFDGLIA